ncbi:MAG: dTMP kinase [Dehalococcoidales bacterium]|nr:dTMP kinase [Dehalococcoidales bacterium]
MSHFITLEGGEGCGKSTQARLLYQRLKKLAVPVILIHEPGVTALGKRVTRLLKWSQDIKISPLAELLLFNVSRAQLVEEVIKPNLEQGINIICDRYSDSTTAYQGYGRRLDLQDVKKVNSIAMQGLVPELTILLDMPVGKGLERKNKIKPDRFQKQSQAFHERVREGFIELAVAEPERWLVIDATKSKETIAGIIWERVSKLVKK